MRQRAQERAGGSFVIEHCKAVVQQFRAGRVLMTVEIMSAAILNIRWNDRAEEQALPISHGGKIPFPSVGLGRRVRHCPACDSIVYSRRHKLCGVCGQLLPVACLFTAAEAENVATLLRIEQQRHRAWLKKSTAL